MAFDERRKRQKVIFSAAVAALGLFASPSAMAQREPIGLARQVTHSFNLDLVPSPDGSRAVMISVVAGREQLFLTAPDGSEPVQITHDDADHEDPAWSPDGARIAFVLTDGETRLVYAMDPDGSNRRPITPPNVRAIHPSWTPDGQRILYSTDDDLRPPAKNESAIYAIDLASGVVETLISGGVNTFPVMSPDGTRIAFRRIVGDMNSEVFVADSDGSNPRNLTNHFSFEGWPAWSPDGERIAFAGNRNGNYQIFLMRADGSDVRLVANTDGRATSPKWTPDGRSIYFTNCRNVDFGRGCEIMRADIS